MRGADHSRTPRTQSGLLDRWQRVELLIQRCDRVLIVGQPADPIAPPAMASSLAQRVRDGRVFTYTVNYHPFNPSVPLPYMIAIVQLAEQADLRLAANIVGCEPDSVTSGCPSRLRSSARTSRTTPCSLRFSRRGAARIC